jgi:hypothetical protein
MQAVNPPPYNAVDRISTASTDFLGDLSQDGPGPSIGLGRKDTVLIVLSTLTIVVVMALAR